MGYPHFSTECSEHHDLVVDFPEHVKPKIVCLCGSTRFTDEMLVKQFLYRSRGILAIGWCAVPSSFHEGPHLGETMGVKEKLDTVHKRIIDICDEVFVLNLNGYIGESTRSEIEYAESIGKPVLYEVPRTVPAFTPMENAGS